MYGFFSRESVSAFGYGEAVVLYGVSGTDSPISSFFSALSNGEKKGKQELWRREPIFKEKGIELNITVHITFHTPL